MKYVIYALVGIVLGAAAAAAVHSHPSTIQTIQDLQ